MIKRVREMLIIDCCKGNNDGINILLNMIRSQYHYVYEYPQQLDLYSIIGNCITYNQSKCLEILLDHIHLDGLPSQLSIYSYEYVQEAIELGNIDIITLLFDKIDINNVNDCYGITLLHLSCREANIDSVKLLIDKNADVFKLDRYGNPPIFLAAQSGSLQLLQLLIKIYKEANIDITSITNIDGESILWFAVIHGNDECVQYLLDEYVTLLSMRNSDGINVCHLAASRGHYNTLKAIVDKGFDVNDKDNQQYSSLHHAAIQLKNPTVIDLLLDNGADINIGDKFNKSPLHLAALLKDSSKNVKILLKSGALIDESSISLYTKVNAKIIRTEINNRQKRITFEKVTKKFINYIPYHIIVMNECYPHHHKGAIPAIGWNASNILLDHYYHKEVLHLLNLHLTNLYSNNQPTMITTNKVNNARNNHKENILMIKLQSYISAFLTLSNEK